MTSIGWTIAVTATGAIFALAVMGTIGALRDEPRVAPGIGTFNAAELEAWTRVRREVDPSFVVLRPAWTPAEFRSDACARPVNGAVHNGEDGRIGPATSRTYAVRYYGSALASGQCAFLDFTGVPDVRSYTGFPDNLVDFGPIYVRGTVAWLRSGTTGASRDLAYYGPSEQLRYLWWNEGGATYEVGGINVSVGDLVEVLLELRPLP